MSKYKDFDGFVAEQYVRVFAPTDMDDVRVCPTGEDKRQAGTEIREAHSLRHTNNG